MITSRARLTPASSTPALQAAGGRSNKQIASDSHISLRTVESHLQGIYEKLGISCSGHATRRHVNAAHTGTTPRPKSSANTRTRSRHATRNTQHAVAQTVRQQSRRRTVNATRTNVCRGLARVCHGWWRSGFHDSPRGAFVTVSYWPWLLESRWRLHYSERPSLSASAPGLLTQPALSEGAGALSATTSTVTHSATSAAKSSPTAATSTATANSTAAAKSATPATSASAAAITNLSNNASNNATNDEATEPVPAEPSSTASVPGPVNGIDATPPSSSPTGATAAAPTAIKPETSSLAPVPSIATPPSLSRYRSVTSAPATSIPAVVPAATKEATGPTSTIVHGVSWRQRRDRFGDQARDTRCCDFRFHRRRAAAVNDLGSEERGDLDTDDRAQRDRRNRRDDQVHDTRSCYLRLPRRRAAAINDLCGEQPGRLDTDDRAQRHRRNRRRERLHHERRDRRHP